MGKSKLSKEILRINSNFRLKEYLALYMSAGSLNYYYHRLAVEYRNANRKKHPNRRVTYNTPRKCELERRANECKTYMLFIREVILVKQRLEVMDIDTFSEEESIYVNKQLDIIMPKIRACIGKP